jgi:hypothetical protein
METILKIMGIIFLNTIKLFLNGYQNNNFSFFKT